MKLRKIAIAASLALGLGITGQATAQTYSGSELEVSGLTIVFFDATGAILTGVNPGYTFNVEDSATLDGNTDGNGAGCSSLVGDCNLAAPVLTIDAANAPGNEVMRANNDYSLRGPIAGEDYSSANAEITNAQLVTGVPTNTKQVSENQVDGSFPDAQASTNIQSNTSFTLSFTIPQGPGPADLLLQFDANPEMEALVNVLNGSGFAQSNMTATVTLNQLNGDTSGGTGFASWSPQGTVANECAFLGLSSCVELADSEDLNVTLGVGPVNSQLDHSLNTAATAFGIRFNGLAAGDWTVTLAALTSVNVTETRVSIPEPGILALMGMGLAGLGLTRRRKRQA